MEKNKNTSSTEKSDKSDEKVGGFKGLVQTVNAFLGIMPLDYIFAAFCSGFCKRATLAAAICFLFCGTSLSKRRAELAMRKSAPGLTGRLT